MIYFDNAATTWPKPVSVIKAVENCMKKSCANPGRSGHDMSMEASQNVYKCREAVAGFFGVNRAENVIFTFNATHGLNIVIRGILKKGDHAVCTCMDHNSVLRPLYSVDGAEVSVASADETGYVSSEKICSLIRPNTRLIVMTHVSNVCGTILPVEEVALVARRKGIPLLVDASQSAGLIDINLEKSRIDFLVCPGHKALFGPMGTGILCINSQCDITPLMYGGTGSYSYLTSQPADLPDRLESGTLNLPGICGLYEGIEFVKSLGFDYIREHERKLVSYFLDSVSEMSFYDIKGIKSTEGRTAVISIVHPFKTSVRLASELNDNYNIATRAMYQCSYKAHEALGTSSDGTLRISMSALTTFSEVETLLYALENIE